MNLVRSFSRRTLTPVFRSSVQHSFALRGLSHNRFLTSSSVRFADAEKKAEEAQQQEADTAKDNSTTEEPAAEEAAPEVVDVEALKKELADCQAKLAATETKVVEANDKLMRLLADMENVRGRAIKDVDNAKKFALQSFAKKLLDTHDNFGWCLAETREAAEKGDNADLKTLYDGIILTQTGFNNVCKSAGVEMFHSLGEKFDPNKHDGLFQFEDPTKEPGTVGQVMKEGYMYNGRVLRPANVGTVKAPAAPKA